MRTIRLSQTFNEELSQLLEQGQDNFGARVALRSSNRVRHTIETFLVRHPRRTVDPILGICAYPVRDVPFVLLYDYDDHELRMHLVIHAKSDRTLVDLSTVVW